MGIKDSLGRSFRVPVKPKQAYIARQGIAPPIDFGTIHERFLYTESNDPSDRANRPRAIFHPSSGLHPDCGGCTREVMFELLCAPMSPQTKSSKLIKILNNGTNRHVGVQADFDRLAKRGFLGIVSSEKEVHCVHPTLPIEGHMDLRVRTNLGWTYAIDFKTASSASCKKTYEPSFKHRVQLLSYMGMSSISTGYVVYENKDNQEWVGPPSRMRVDMDEAGKRLYREVEDYCNSLLVQLKAEQIPEYNDDICQACNTFCWYRETCAKHIAGLLTFSQIDQRTPEQKKRHLPIVRKA